MRSYIFQEQNSRSKEITTNTMNCPLKDGHRVTADARGLNMVDRSSLTDNPRENSVSLIKIYGQALTSPVARKEATAARGMIMIARRYLCHCAAITSNHIANTIGRTYAQFEHDLSGHCRIFFFFFLKAFEKVFFHFLAFAILGQIKVAPT